MSQTRLRRQTKGQLISGAGDVSGVRVAAREVLMFCDIRLTECLI